MGGYTRALYLGSNAPFCWLLWVGTVGEFGSGTRRPRVSPLFHIREQALRARRLCVSGFVGRRDLQTGITRVANPSQRFIFQLILTSTYDVSNVFRRTEFVFSIKERCQQSAT